MEIENWHTNAVNSKYRVCPKNIKLRVGGVESTGACMHISGPRKSQNRWGKPVYGTNGIGNFSPFVLGGGEGRFLQ